MIFVKKKNKENDNHLNRDREYLQVRFYSAKIISK